MKELKGCKTQFDIATKLQKEDYSVDQILESHELGDSVLTFEEAL